MHDVDNMDPTEADHVPTPDSCNPAPVSGTYFCFDFGQKRIGLAVGHSDTKSANPLTVIRNINGRPEWQHIDERVKEWKPAGIVVGLPVHEQDGQESKVRLDSHLQRNQTDRKQQNEDQQRRNVPAGRQPFDSNAQQLVLSAAFSKKLRHRYNIPVYRCDERYSSIEAARLLAENRSRGNRKKVGREDLDKVAAAIILNQWFNNEFE